MAKKDSGLDSTDAVKLSGSGLATFSGLWTGSVVLGVEVEAGDDDVEVVEVEDDVVEVDEITLKAAKKDRISVCTGLVWAEWAASAGP